ncbi:MAG: hypothetical protein ACOCYN_01270 [Planctomycetota bacterium]
MRNPLCRTVLACALVTCGAASASAEETDMSPDAQRMEAKLESFLVGRTGVYELDFEPLSMERVLIDNRIGHDRVYHYLTFRLRNRTSTSATALTPSATAFDEVMNTILREYQGLRYDQETGIKLIDESAQNLRDERLRVIVEREDLEVKARRIDLTVRAYDENKTSFRLFDEFYDIEEEEIREQMRQAGQNPEGQDLSPSQKDRFDFTELGATQVGTYYSQVHAAIEEQEDRHLFSVHEIRRMRLPPYQPGVLDPMTNEPVGQIHGVLIFDRLPVEGDFFTVEIQGLSNKLRFQVPPHPDDQLANYFDTRILRRTYVVRYSRRGDEYYRDLDDFERQSKGWQWLSSFQRLRSRASIAYNKYFLNNIGTTNAQGHVVPDPQVESHFWQYHRKQREEVLPKALQEKEASLVNQMQDLEEFYTGLIEARKLEMHKTAVERRYRARREALEAELARVRRAQKALPEALPSEDELLNPDALRKMLEAGVDDGSGEGATDTGGGADDDAGWGAGGL